MEKDTAIDDLFSLAEGTLQEELGTIAPDAQEDLILDELKVSGETEEAGAFEEVAEEKLPTEPLEAVQVMSIVESLLLATDRPLTMATMKEVFKGTYTKTEKIRKALDMLAVEYAGAPRGMTLEEVAGGFQLRTKEDNRVFVRRMTKARPFRLSGPGLETLAIVAYKQPITKHEIDEIRGVDSGHLVRALMDRGLVRFGGKSDLPGKPMLYETARKFLEIFGLRDLRELPSVAEIHDLIPEGIIDDEEKVNLSSLTEGMSMTYEHDEGRQEEYEKITTQLTEINTTTDFFEKEKERQRMKRDSDRADDIREKMAAGEVVDSKDTKWLERHEKPVASEEPVAPQAPQVAEEPPATTLENYQEKKMEEALADFDAEEFEDSEESEKT